MDNLSSIEHDLLPILLFHWR